MIVFIDSGQSYRLYAAVYIASCICKVAAELFRLNGARTGTVAQIGPCRI